MKYIGRYTAGGADHDPRQKTYVKYECEDCGHVMEEEKTATIRLGTWQPRTNMKCASCGSYGQTNEAREKQLKERLDELTKTKSNVEIEIERVLSQLHEMGASDEDDKVEEERRSKSLLWSE